MMVGVVAARPHPLAPSPEGEGETRIDILKPLPFRRGVGVRSLLTPPGVWLRKTQPAKSRKHKQMYPEVAATS